MSNYEEVKQSIMDAGKFADLHIALSYEDKVRTFIEGAMRDTGLEGGLPIVVTILEAHFFTYGGHPEEMDKCLNDLEESLGKERSAAYLRCANDVFKKMKDEYWNVIRLPNMKYILALINARLIDEQSS